MSRTNQFKTVRISGYCDEFSENKAIDVKFQKCEVAGDPHTYAITTGFSCADSSRCSRTQACPIYESASTECYW